MKITHTDVGIIVARFQVDKLNESYLMLLQSVMNAHKQVILFLGTSLALVTRNNPFDFALRKAMIQKEFPQLTILSIPDMPSDYDWSNELDKRINDAYPNATVVLYGNSNRFIKRYHGNFETKALAAGTNYNVLETEIKNTPDFRAGVVFATQNQYPKVYPTVDVAIVDGDKVLLGRKPNQTKFRFIGGFVDTTDTSFEAAAKREAYEETNLEVEEIQYIGTAKIDDWRYRYEQDKIISTFFSAKKITGSPSAKDDICELKWFYFSELTTEDIVEEHGVLLALFKQKFYKTI